MDKLEMIMTLSIPIIAIVMGCGIPILAIYLGYRQRKEIYEKHHQLCLAAIERGLEVPQLPEAFFEEDPEAHPGAPRRDLLKGLVWLFAGLGAIWGLQGIELLPASLGAIPAGVGVAYLIYHFVEGRREASEFHPINPDPDNKIEPTSVSL